MATALKLGPKDHGRSIASLDEFMSASYKEGYQYELIDGKLYATPQANLPENRNEEWLVDKVKEYARLRPDVINYVTNKARVFVHGRTRTTCPEPDLAAYRDYPLDADFRAVRWQEVEPILVGEVASIDDPDKDWVRNVRLYLRVPSIREYWLLDTRQDPNRPTMRVHRRQGRKWQRIDLSFGATYTTRLLPGFKLILDPRR